jgi:hypothetical protein
MRGCSPPADEATGHETVEVSHEALIREWNTYRGWVDADREFLRTVERVKDAMRAWAEEEADKDSRLLAPGRPLEEARELLSRPHALIDDIRPFIEASIAHDDGRVAEEQRRIEAEKQREIERRTRLPQPSAAAAPRRRSGCRARVRHRRRLVRLRPNQAKKKPAGESRAARQPLPPGDRAAMRSRASAWPCRASAAWIDRTGRWSTKQSLPRHGPISVPHGENPPRSRNGRQIGGVQPDGRTSSRLLDIQRGCGRCHGEKRPFCAAR